MLMLAMATAVLWMQYASVLQRPNATLFSGTGDGLKNYYAFAYHIKHDTTLMQFGGMNHPFGEQIGYPDAQPALSNFTKLLSRVYPALGEHSVAVINLSALFGMVLTALSIHLIFRFFGVHWFYAAISGIALTALSPQTLRLQAAHHGLAYGWTLTFALYFLLRTLKASHPLRWGLSGAFITLAGLYLHPYTGMIASAWMGFILLFVATPLLRERQHARLLSAGLMVLMPIVSFLLLQRLTDHHAGRTQHPLGFFDYCTHWSGVLAPPSGYRSALSWFLIPQNMPQEFEASAYLGIGALLGLLVMLVLGSLRWALRFPTKDGTQPWPRLVSVAALASLPLFVFAFGLPFNEAHGPYPWSVPFLGQFRSPGRFAWASYYAIGLFALYGAWWCWQCSKGLSRVLASLFLITMPSIYLYEARAMHIQVSSSISNNRNVLSPGGLSQQERVLLSRIDPSRYRAIIPVPIFLAGSDERLLMPDDRTMHMAMLLSYWTGLPMTAYSLARTSVPETIEQIGTFTSPWYERPISERYEGDDRFLLIMATEPANDEERRYFSMAHPVAAHGEVRLASISASELFKDRTEDVFKWIENSQAYVRPDGWGCTKPDARIFHFSHDDRSSPHVYQGTGGYSGAKREVNTFATIPENTLLEGERYVASYWTYTPGALRSHALTCVAERDPTSGREEWITCSDMRFARIVNGDWSLVELPFTAARDEHQYRIFAEGRKTYQDTIYCDEVMVRPADVDVFRVLQREGDRITRVLYNGHFLTRPR